jgi:simple sugar transport system substrate-binding protein
MEYGKMTPARRLPPRPQDRVLGPLINDETCCLASSVPVGRQRTQVLKKDLKDLTFTVNWIGFWFNIPGVTSDPTQVADNFFKSGYDVVVSGIDTTEALVEAGKLAATGKKVWAIPYDFAGSLDEAPTVALGVPYFNWGPAYLKAVTAASQGQWTSFWEWNAPDWTDINNPDTSAVGFKKGEGLTADARRRWTSSSSAGGGLNLWNLSPGWHRLPERRRSHPQQIWYLPQLLQAWKARAYLIEFAVA